MFSNFTSHITKFAQNIANHCECNYKTCFCTLGATESNSEAPVDAFFQTAYRGLFSDDIFRQFDARCIHIKDSPPVIPLEDLQRFIEDCFCSVGVTETNAQLLADVIVQADYKGVFAEGVLRLEQYIQEIQNNACDPTAKPDIENESSCVAVVNGNNGLGPVIATFCMGMAMKKALKNGVGMVVAKGSNYYGMGSIYTEQALKEGLIGLSLSNGVPQMVPPGASKVALGTNPISVAAPANCDAFSADLSSTTVTLPKILNYKLKKLKLPKGWALNKKGQVEVDPTIAFDSKMLSPLGGDQGHKGYGLAIAVEALSGLLADSNYGPKIPMENCKPPNLGHGFIAINPKEFASDFGTRLSKLLNHLRTMAPADPKKPVLAPGDKERLNMKMVDCNGGICYPRFQLEILENMSKSLNVQPIARVKQIIKKMNEMPCEDENDETPDTVKPIATPCDQEVAPVGKVNPKIMASLDKKTYSCSTEPKKNVAPAKANQTITTVEEARRFMVDCFKAVGTPKEHAEIVAGNLIEADCRGYYSHGMNRLDKYIKDIQEGVCDPKATCTIDKQTTATALVDGNNGLGAVVGKFCMDLAIKKAGDTGIAVVLAHGSNHYGISQIYPLQAINQGFLGMSFTNTSPYMVPTRAIEAALGTNPLSLGAPALNGDKFVLDITTTAVALGKIELSKRKGERILEGWALNDEGKVETDPGVAYKAGKLLPLGGMEITAGYKGYSLGVLVDMLSGILSGSKYGPFIRKWGKKSDIANLGHAFIAINPNCFTAGFEERMNDLITNLRKMKPNDPKRPILVHGDIERKNMEKVEKDGGLIYVQNQHETNAKLAEQLKVNPMVSKASS